MNKKEKNKEYKSFKFQLKDMNEGTGEFEGYASIFGSVDQGGDIVQKGAFSRSINNRGTSPFPILFSHDFREPAIGKATLSEDSIGLFTKGKLFIDRTEKIKHIFLNMKDDVSNSMSFMYDVIQSTFGEIEGNAVRYLKELRIFEVSILNSGFGMHEQAGITTVKQTEIEARELEKRLKAIETTLEQLKQNTNDKDFKTKIEEDLNALHQKIAELAPKKDTFADDELAVITKSVREITAQIYELNKN